MAVPSGPVTSTGEVGQSSDSARLMLVRECSLWEGGRWKRRGKKEGKEGDRKGKDKGRGGGGRKRKRREKRGVEGERGKQQVSQKTKEKRRTLAPQTNSLPVNSGM